MWIGVRVAKMQDDGDTAFDANAPPPAWVLKKTVQQKSITVPCFSS